MPKKKPAEAAKRLSVEERRQTDLFARRLRELMTRHNVSVTKLARYTGLRAETVRSYRKGTNRPSNANLQRLSQIFGSSLAQVFAGTQLAGADNDPVVAINAPNDMTILQTYVVLPNAAWAATQEVWRQHGVRVGEPGPPVYADKPAEPRKG